MLPDMSITRTILSFFDLAIAKFTVVLVHWFIGGLAPEVMKISKLTSSITCCQDSECKSNDENESQDSNTLRRSLSWTIRPWFHNHRIMIMIPPWLKCAQCCDTAFWAKVKTPLTIFLLVRSCVALGFCLRLILLVWDHVAHYHMPNSRVLTGRWVLNMQTFWSGNWMVGTEPLPSFEVIDTETDGLLNPWEN